MEHSTDRPHEIVVTVDTKGRVTLPPKLRKLLNIGPHAEIAFVLEETGAVRIEKRQPFSLAALRGAAGMLDRDLSWREARQLAREDGILGIDYSPK